MLHELVTVSSMTLTSSSSEHTSKRREEAKQRLKTLGLSGRAKSVSKKFSKAYDRTRVQKGKLRKAMEEVVKKWWVTFRSYALAELATAERTFDELLASFKAVHANAFDLSWLVYTSDAADAERRKQNSDPVEQRLKTLGLSRKTVSTMFKEGYDFARVQENKDYKAKEVVRKWWVTFQSHAEAEVATAQRTFDELIASFKAVHANAFDLSALESP